jgi:hypothetical protein
MTVAAFLLTMGSVSFNNRNIFGNTLLATTTCSNYNPAGLEINCYYFSVFYTSRV